MSNSRKIYLDNIKWTTVFLVLLFHVCYLFNGVGVLGGIPGALNIQAFDTFACIVYPWLMVLLFLVAGMSARYSLRKRTGKQFIRERTVRLLVPSTLGLFVIHWITGYLNIKMSIGFTDIPAAWIYPVLVISGTGALWFIQMLFIFSCILLVLIKMDESDLLWTLCGKVNSPIILLLFVLIFGSAQILNMPVLVMYRFGIYFVSFLIGYYIFSHDEVQAAIEKTRTRTLCLAIITAYFYARCYQGSDYTSPECLQSVITNFYLWIVVLAIMGYSRKYFNRETTFTRYMTKSGFGIYVLHYPVLITFCYILHFYFDFPAIWNYLSAFVVGTVMTFIVYEGIKRMPSIHFLVLGIKSEK